jgi:hypothetical protein
MAVTEYLLNKCYQYKMEKKEGAVLLSHVTRWGWKEIAVKLIDVLKLERAYFLEDTPLNPLLSAVVYDQAAVLEYMLKKSVDKSVLSDASFDTYYGNRQGILKAAARYASAAAFKVLMKYKATFSSADLDSALGMVKGMIANPYRSSMELEPFDKDFIARLKKIEILLEKAGAYAEANEGWW